MDSNFNKFETLNMSNIVFIAIQGATCTGKTTLAQNIASNLKEILCVEIISLDNYYLPTPDLDCVNEYYNFDTPGALDFNSLDETLCAYIEEKQEIPKRKYDFMHMTSEKYLEKNTHPKVIILEGLYAFNIFEKNIFDTTVLNPRMELNHLLRLNPKSFYINNFFKIYKKGNCHIFKLLLPISRELCRKIRLQRDCTLRFKEASDEFKKDCARKFDHSIWPAINQWVYFKNNTYDYVIENGSRNVLECKSFILNMYGLLKKTHESITSNLKNGEKIILKDFNEIVFKIENNIVFDLED
ncbi:udk [Ecytonucleospora hepatopenaei]|uniref:Udk n=1 Tax=Ecytonucleospora hepatopenaei TaxID=646526 RepID=A0A1W0E8J4_9MICR|nr:udk [Ecytonucleospora hepatopenaei]